MWPDGEAWVLANSRGQDHAVLGRSPTTAAWWATLPSARRETPSARSSTQAHHRRQFSEQEEIKIMPFTVKEDKATGPIIEVEVDDEPKDFTPEQISAMVLEKMKKPERWRYRPR